MAYTTKRPELWPFWFSMPRQAIPADEDFRGATTRLARPIGALVLTRIVEANLVGSALSPAWNFES